MKVVLGVIKYCIIFLFITLSLSSCSYGFFNFSGDSGEIRINFEFENDNALSVDKIILHLTPPAGQSATITMHVSSSSGYSSLSNMDTGFWKLTAELYSGDELVQGPEDIDDSDDSAGIRVVRDSSTTVNIRARWNAKEYELAVDTWVDSFNDSGTSSTPAFTFTGMHVMPVAYESYRSGERIEQVYIRAYGSDFLDGLESLHLAYPDGLIYEFGSDYSRGIEFNHYITDDIIEIKRGGVFDGDYTIRLQDWGQTFYSETDVLSLDVEELMPSITTPGISSTVVSTVDQSFNYKFESSTDIGTCLVFLINRSSGQVYPPDNSMVVPLNTGTLIVPNAELLINDEYDLIVAALEHPTVTPFDDAVTAGVTDMRAEVFSESIYEIYGKDTGFILYESVRFTAF